MTAAPRPVPPLSENQEEEEVDVDLDAEDALLREAIGAPTTIRLKGTILVIPHSLEWTVEATRYFGIGAWDAWAEEVLAEEEFKIWKEANLRNYQLEAISKKLLAQLGVGRGKSPQSSTPRRSTQRR